MAQDDRRGAAEQADEARTRLKEGVDKARRLVEEMRGRLEGQVSRRGLDRSEADHDAGLSGGAA